MTDSTRRLPRASAALRRLASACEVYLPGDDGYLEATIPWNFAVKQRPAAVVYPRNIDDVRAAVAAATADGLRVTVQSTGHNPAPLAVESLADVMLIQMSKMTGVTVDPARRTARVVGGTLSRELVDAAAAHGLAALHGSAPDVAVAGFTSGGGFSWYARQHGLAANSVLAVELVTPDARLVRADAESNPELFWAVRGGGGNFGVITALELRLYDIPTVYGGMLLWDVDRAPDVATAWRRWTQSVPESVTTSLRVMSFPEMDDLPPFLNGRHVIVVDGAVLEADETAVDILEPLVDLDPEVNTLGRMPASALIDMHMDPPGPTPVAGMGTSLASFDDDAVDALLRVVGPGTRSPLLFAEIRHLGGAAARPAEHAGALSHLSAPYLLYGVGIAPSPADAADVMRGVGELHDALKPWAGHEAVLNFAEQPTDVMSAFPPGSHQRLYEARRTWDPRGVMVANHRIPSTPGRPRGAARSGDRGRW